MHIEDPVLVVGGGATGTAVARDLAMSGLTVRLVERGGLASETTGHSHGVLHSGARYAESDPTGAAECLAENQVLGEIAPACVDETGGLFVQIAGDDPDYFDRKRRACQDLAIPVESVDPSRLTERQPALAPDIERAFRVPDGVVYPGRLTVAQAHDAAEHGAQIHPHTALVDLETDGGTVTRAILERRGAGTEHLGVSHVVNASGAWAGRVAALADLTVEMRPTRGVMVVVDGPDLEPVVNRCRPPADGDIVVPSRGRLVCGTTSVAVTDPDRYPRPDGSVSTVRQACAAMVPAVDSAPVAETYWGVRPLYASPNDARAGDERGISRDFRVIDHAEQDGVAGLTTVVGGKLTTCRAMGEAVAKRVTASLGTSRTADTATTPLSAGDDPDELEELMVRYDVDAPAG